MTNNETQPNDVQQVTDPVRIRALAHPLRLRIFDILNEHTEVTATEVAEMTGESAASCSFHLRQLEKYGYVERAQARGREKPWRSVAPSWQMRPVPGSDGSTRAVQELATLGLDSEWDRVRRFFASAEQETDQWIQSTTFTRASFWATAEELAELSRELEQITNRFAAREENPSQRPEGARKARMVAITNPEPVAPPAANVKEQS